MWWHSSTMPCLTGRGKGHEWANEKAYWILASVHFVVQLHAVIQEESSLHLGQVHVFYIHHPTFFPLSNSRSWVISFFFRFFPLSFWSSTSHHPFHSFLYDNLHPLGECLKERGSTTITTMTTYIYINQLYVCRYTRGFIWSASNTSHHTHAHAHTHAYTHIRIQKLSFSPDKERPGHHHTPFFTGRSASFFPSFSSSSCVVNTRLPSSSASRFPILLSFFITSSSTSPITNTTPFHVYITSNSIIL